MQAREDQASQTVWAKELMAEQCGHVFDRLWDAINAGTNKLGILAQFGVGGIALPRFPAPESIGHGIVLYLPALTNEPAGLPDPAGSDLSLAAWRDWLDARARSGWELGQVEFRHNRFELGAGGQPSRSVFAFRAHLTRAQPETRAALEGDLVVHWAPAAGADAPPGVRHVDARRLQLTTREGPPAFRETLSEVVPPPAKSHFIDPLILHDLNGDGRPEIILAARNRVYQLGADGRFQTRELCQHWPGLIFTAVIADFDGDGIDDFLFARFEGLFLIRGAPGGRFDEPPQPVWAAPERVRYGQVLTGGDVDGDGDLDVWFGQYKNPYDGGQMPTPYYDANDGNPSYLLLNDGHGHFTDATEAAGLAPKRWRRIYAASLMDLDEDGKMDLLTVSDFAGVAIYANDGRGHFTEVTARRLADPQGFGMAHALADFNADGRLDLFVTGMHCPTARRLLHLGLSRPERPDYLAMASAMTAGNKLLLAQADGRFNEVAPAAGVARSGWSWGCAAADFDNDGWPDLAIANGHETRQSVQDYESEFWLHDLYLADSKEDPVKAIYFASKINRTRGQGMSYGGYEQNRLFLNRGGRAFIDVAHLLGVALGDDSRNLVAADLDGDGRVDLIVTTFEVWPEERQTVRVFRNELPTAGNWIAAHLRGATGVSPIGATVTVRLPGGRSVVQPIVTGDSHRSQSANTVHFGLGTASAVEAVDVRWPGGRQSHLAQPAVNRVHEVDPPPK